MIEIIFHARGGQGGVTASQILATAAFFEKKYSHAVPYFRGERKGAPVLAYARVSDDPMVERGPIINPDIAIIMDAALLKTVNPLKPIKPNGLAIINTGKSPAEILQASENKTIRISTLDATALSEKIYGKSAIPKVNILMLGSLAALTKMVRVESILAAIDEYFTGDNGAKAKESVKLAYDHVLGTMQK
jgi:2-oxoacid:acceptor oxidoreductase gamma subunit (pyruvate/2-ketoisovalerate family)